MNIGIVGLGYVGFPLAVLAAKKGYKITAIDISREKVALVNSGKSPLEDEPAVSSKIMERIYASTDFSGLKQVETIIVSVPTPIKVNHQPNLKPLIQAITAIGKELRSGQHVITESTVYPGVNTDILLPLLKKMSRLKCGAEFYLSHCPERINPGDKKWKVGNIPRVVGSYNKVGLKKAVDFYKSIIDGEIMTMDSLMEAEAVKIVENCFRDVNIAFVNELAMSFDKLGINVKKIIQGACTKPFAFMPHYPGCGVGGHCIPVDPYYLIEHARARGFEHKFLTAARSINNHMPEYCVNRLVEGLNEASLSLKSTTIAVLGVSYKSNISDCRESPSFTLIKLLKDKGAKVIIFDPYVLQKSTVRTLDAALKDSKAILLATYHDEFKGLSPKLLDRRGIRVLVDGRNALNPQIYKDAGIIYKGIGVN